METLNKMEALRALKERLGMVNEKKSRELMAVENELRELYNHTTHPDNRSTLNNRIRRELKNNYDLSNE